MQRGGKYYSWMQIFESMPKFNFASFGVSTSPCQNRLKGVYPY